MEKYVMEKEKEIKQLKSDTSNQNKKINKDLEKEYLQKIEYFFFIGKLFLDRKIMNQHNFLPKQQKLKKRKRALKKD